MISLIAWICLAYGLAAAAVHFVYKRSGHEIPPSAVHYVLVTRNHGSQLEWYLRAIGWHSVLRSVPYTVTLADDSSDDDTLQIAGRMGASEGLNLQVVPFSELSSQTDSTRQFGEHQDESICIVDLRKPGEASKIPYVHVS